MFRFLVSSLLASLLSLTALAGCSATEEGDPAAAEPQLGESGVFQFALSGHESPVVGANTFELTLTGADDDAPVTGATIGVMVMMPAHGHGGGEPTAVRELGEGRYELSPVDFTMAGGWEVTIEAAAGDRSDQTTFAIDVK